MYLSNRKNKFVVFVISFLFILFTVITTAEARNDNRRSGGFSKKGIASSGSIKRHKNINRRAVNKRHAKKAIVRDNRHERKKDFRDERHERREDFRDERRERYERWENRRTVRRILGAAALTSIAFNRLSCRHEEIFVEGLSYTRCGKKWYEPVHRGGSVTYVIIEAPYGY